MNIHKRYFLIIIVSLILFSNITYSNNQARIVFHPSLNLSSNTDLYLRFVFPDIVSSHFPYVWLGPRINISKYLSCAIMGGLTFKDKENTGKISLFPVYKRGDISIWNEVDYNISTKNIYYFLIARYNLLGNRIIRLGIDCENLFDRINYFYSIGPSIDIIFGSNIVISLSYFNRWMLNKQNNYLRFYLILK
jgi:hypothetical protein